MQKEAKAKTIILFNQQKIRRQWDEEKELWFFSVIDVVRILTDSTDARKYWNKLSERLRKEGSESVTKCHQLKLESSGGRTWNNSFNTSYLLLSLSKTEKRIKSSFSAH